MPTHRSLSLFLSLFCASVLTHCADEHAAISADIPAAPAAKMEGAKSMQESPSASRRGIIGTKAGSWEHARREQRQFVRLNPKKPDGLLVIDYRDESSIHRKTMGKLPVLQDPAGLSQIKFIGEGGWSSSLDVYLSQYSSRPILLGKKGQAYAIELTNLTDSSIEVVISIDGLNTAAYGGYERASSSSRGYIIDAKKTFIVRGWTAGYNGIRRFQFADAENSLSSTHPNVGSVPDIGTIGFAIFKSKTAVTAGTRGRAFADM